MKCCQCGKELNEFTAKLISCDGDFVCNDKCYADFNKEMDSVRSMSDSEFDGWIFRDKTTER